MPPRFGPPGHPGPPGPLGIPPLGPPMGPPFMMRLARGGRRGGMAGKGGKNKKMKGKSGTNRPQAELEAAELVKPWVTDAIRPEIVKKHKLHADARASKDVKDWEAFKEQKKKVAVMVNEAKLEYIGSHPEEVIDEADHDDIHEEEEEEEEEEEDDDCEDGNNWQHGAEESYNPAHVDGVDEQNASEISYDAQWNWCQDPYVSYYTSTATTEVTQETDASSSTMSANTSADQNQETNNQYDYYGYYNYASQYHGSNASTDGSHQYQAQETNGQSDYYGYYSPSTQNHGSIGLTESQQYQPQETGSQYSNNGYYNSATQSYGSPGKDLGYSQGYNQWYNQEYEQVYASYQQYSVPYQQHQNEYSIAVHPSPNSYIHSPSKPYNQKNRHSGNFNKRIDVPFSLFYCESCDRSFPNDAKLQEHLSEHRTCGIDGCKFTAHTKVVDNHVRMQHDTGLYRRMISNDDTEKWRAERKKKYPSQANIEVRQLQQQEMIKRGERLGFDQNRSGNSRGRGGPAGSSGRGRGRPNPTSNVPNPNLSEVKVEKLSASEWRPQFPIPVVQDIEIVNRGKLVKFPGTGNFKSDQDKIEEAMAASGALNTLCGYGAGSSEDEANDHNNLVPDKNSAEVTGTPCVDTSQIKESFDVQVNETSISSQHDSMHQSENGSESDGSAPEEMPISKPTCSNDIGSLEQPDKPEVTRKRKRHHAKHGEPKKAKDDTSVQPLMSETDKKSCDENSLPQSGNKSRPPFGRRGKGKDSFQNSRHNFKRPPTLLEKLLAPDIQQERNIILQCIRYVVEQNFFKGAENSFGIKAPVAN